MTYQSMVKKYKKIIAEQEEIVLQLRVANTTLLENNVALSNKIKLLEGMNDTKAKMISNLEVEKSTCKQKCELAIRQKDQIIAEKQKYIDGCRSTFERLRDGKWFYEIKMEQDGKIAIIHRVAPG